MSVRSRPSPGRGVRVGSEGRSHAFGKGVFVLTCGQPLDVELSLAVREGHLAEIDAELVGLRDLPTRLVDPEPRGRLGNRDSPSKAAAAETAEPTDQARSDETPSDDGSE